MLSDDFAPEARCWAFGAGSALLSSHARRAGCSFGSIIQPRQAVHYTSRRAVQVKGEVHRTGLHQVLFSGGSTIRTLPKRTSFMMLRSCASCCDILKRVANRPSGILSCKQSRQLQVWLTHQALLQKQVCRSAAQAAPEPRPPAAVPSSKAAAGRLTASTPHSVLASPDVAASAAPSWPRAACSQSTGTSRMRGARARSATAGRSCRAGRR